jgi:hypothetical protein
MTYNLFNTPTYHFDASQPGGQDAILYYHRVFTAEEIDKLRDILYSFLRQKNRKSTAQFFLTLAEFPEAVESLKAQIAQYGH